MDRANIGPANGFGVGAEMIIAEGLQAREHGVDLGFGGDEGREGFGIVGLGASAHGVFPGLSRRGLRRACPQNPSFAGPIQLNNPQHDCVDRLSSFDGLFGRTGQFGTIQ